VLVGFFIASNAAWHWASEARTARSNEERTSTIAAHEGSESSERGCAVMADWWRMSRRSLLL